MKISVREEDSLKPTTKNHNLGFRFLFFLRFHKIIFYLIPLLAYHVCFCFIAFYKTKRILISYLVYKYMIIFFLAKEKKYDQTLFGVPINLKHYFILSNFININCKTQPNQTLSEQNFNITQPK